MYHPVTHVPNVLFDTHLKTLGYAELKVLLVIIRQTQGWKDPRTGKAKEWDWISGLFFVKKTGLSKRAVSKALSTLCKKKLIRIRNEKGNPMLHAYERKRAFKLYFSLHPKATKVLTS